MVRIFFPIGVSATSVRKIPITDYTNNSPSDKFLNFEQLIPQMNYLFFKRISSMHYHIFIR